MEGVADGKSHRAGGPSVAWVDGAVVPMAEARVPIEDRGLQFGESLYEVVAVTGGVARNLPEHVERMSSAAGVLGLALGVPSLEGWRAMVAELFARDSFGEALLYAQITGGVAPRRHLPDLPPKPSFFAYLRPFEFPRAAAVVRGIRAITLEDLRWARCDLKTTMLLPAVMAKRQALSRGAGEALWVSEGGVVREGAASNLMIVEGGRIVTPAQTRHLLPGVTRPVIGALASAAGLAMESDTLPLERVLRADEVFVTSTTLTVMGVVAIDDQPITDGRAGAITRDLASRLRGAWQIDGDGRASIP